MALDVHLVTPEREVWAGPAQMVIARGTDGMVGILAGHAPLLIRLSIAPIKIQHEDGRWFVAVVDGGFLHVTNTEDSTRVDVLASFAELSDEIDRAAAESWLERYALMPRDRAAQRPADDVRHVDPWVAGVAHPRALRRRG